MIKLKLNFKEFNIENYSILFQKYFPPTSKSPQPVQATSIVTSVIDPMFQDRFVDQKEVDCRSSIAPFVLLPSNETPMTFSNSVQLAYDGKLPISKFETACGYAEDIYNNLEDTTFTIEECMALYLYTCEWKSDNPYSLLNTSLTNPDRTSLQKWSHYLHYFLGGLRKIPKWKGNQDLYRGVSLDLVSMYPKKYKVGGKITWYSCTSTTTILNSIISFLPPAKPRTIFTINGVFFQGDHCSQYLHFLKKLRCYYPLQHVLRLFLL